MLFSEDGAFDVLPQSQELCMSDVFGRGPGRKAYLRLQYWVRPPLAILSFRPADPEWSLGHFDGVEFLEKRILAIAIASLGFTDIGELSVTKFAERNRLHSAGGFSPSSDQK